MTKFFMQKLNKKGFTLAELLVVIAIIAVLVAIAIPVFTAQVEKAREAADAANLRAAYAQAAIKALDDTAAAPAAVIITQKTAGWTDTTISIGGVKVTDTSLSALVAGDSVTVTVSETGVPVFTKG